MTSDDDFLISPFAHGDEPDASALSFQGIVLTALKLVGAMLPNH